jgi:hypothetical protein
VLFITERSLMNSESAARSRARGRECMADCGSR